MSMFCSKGLHRAQIWFNIEQLDISICKVQKHGNIQWARLYLLTPKHKFLNKPV